MQARPPTPQPDARADPEAHPGPGLNAGLGPSAAAASPAARRRAVRRAARARVALVAAATLAGTAFAAAPGVQLNPERAATACLLLSLASFSLPRPASRAALLIAVATLAALLTDVRLDRPPAHAARVRLAATQPGSILTARGTVRTSPAPSRYAPGPLDRYLFAARGSSFVLDLDTFVTESAELPTSGRLRVGLERHPSLELRPGQRLSVTGRYTPPGAPTNPGQFDARPLDAQRGSAGFLASSASLIEPADRGGPIARVGGVARRWAAEARDRARRVLLGDDRDDPPRGRLVLAALVLGERSAGLDRTRRVFAESGVAHLLALSGFHLAALALVTLGLVRAVADTGRLAPLLTAAVVAAYLLIVPANVPIVRAGAVTIALLLADAAGRRYDPLALLGWAAVAIALARPAETATLGFRLSFLVTAGLIWVGGAHPLLINQADRPDRLRAAPAGPLARLRSAARWLARAAFVAVGAWAIAAPLVLHHTGSISPIGPLAALLMTPLAMVATASGFACVALGLLVPPLGSLAAGWAGGVGELTAAAIDSIHALRAGPIRAGPVPLLAALPATALLLLAWRGARPPRVAACAISAAAILAVALRLGTALPPRDALRAEMLDVGDGTAVLLRARGAAVLWDAGSLTPGAGRWIIPRAARALGAPRVREAVLSHANIDHYAGLPEAARALGIERLRLSPHALDALRTSSPGRALLAELDQLNVHIETIAAGETIRLGSVTGTVLWPPAELPPGITRANDRSLVVRFDAPTADGTRSLLMTGDTDRAAIDHLLRRPDALRAHALELPHHGAHHARAEAFYRAMRPRAVLQSTGPRRLDPPGWRDEAAALQADGGGWFVTARDGAVSLRLGRDGSVRTEAFLDRPGGGGGLSPGPPRP